MLKDGHQKIKQVIFKNVYLSNIQLKQLTVKILFKVIFEKLVYVWYAFCQFFSYNQMEATKELVWLECLLSSIFVMEKLKNLFLWSLFYTLPFKSGSTWKWYISIPCSCWHVVLTMVWKTWYNCDTFYMIQTIAYQYSAPTKGLPSCVGLYMTTIRHSSKTWKSLRSSKCFDWEILFLFLLKVFIPILLARMCVSVISPIHRRIYLVSPYIPTQLEILCQRIYSPVNPSPSVFLDFSVPVLVCLLPVFSQKWLVSCRFNISN